MWDTSIETIYTEFESEKEKTRKEKGACYGAEWWTQIQTVYDTQGLFTDRKQGKQNPRGGKTRTNLTRED